MANTDVLIDRAALGPLPGLNYSDTYFPIIVYPAEVQVKIDNAIPTIDGPNLIRLSPQLVLEEAKTTAFISSELELFTSKSFSAIPQLVRLTPNMFIDGNKLEVFVNDDRTMVPGFTEINVVRQLSLASEEFRVPMSTTTSDSIIPAFVSVTTYQSNTSLYNNIDNRLARLSSSTYHFNEGRVVITPNTNTIQYAKAKIVITGTGSGIDVNSPPNTLTVRNRRSYSGTRDRAVVNIENMSNFSFITLYTKSVTTVITDIPINPVEAAELTDNSLISLGKLPKPINGNGSIVEARANINDDKQLTHQELLTRVPSIRPYITPRPPGATELNTSTTAFTSKGAIIVYASDFKTVIIEQTKAFFVEQIWY
jgi:hypothetical protein